MVNAQMSLDPISQSHEKTKAQAQGFDNVDIKGFLKQNQKTAAKVQLTRPEQLNAVQDPRARDHSIGNSSGAEDSMSINRNSNPFPPGSVNGYLSNGGMQTDNESARLSNVQPYKYNHLPNKLKDNPNAVNIKKIHPNQVQLAPVSRNKSRQGSRANSRNLVEGYNKASSVVMAPTGIKSIIGAGDHYGAESMLSGVSTGVNTNLLPQLKPGKDNQSAAAGPVDMNLKRANAEALQLLIQNKNKK